MSDAGVFEQLYDLGLYFVNVDGKSPARFGGPRAGHRNKEALLNNLAQGAGMSTTGGYIPEVHKYLVQFDVDMKDGKNGVDSLNRFQERYGQLPKTITVRSPSGGLHLYFYSRHKIGCPTLDDYRGLEIKGDGGICVCPPTPGYTMTEWNEGQIPDLNEAHEMVLRARDQTAPACNEAGIPTFHLAPDFDVVKAMNMAIPHRELLRIYKYTPTAKADFVRHPDATSVENTHLMPPKGVPWHGEDEVSWHFGENDRLHGAGIVDNVTLLRVLKHGGDPKNWRDRWPETITDAAEWLRCKGLLPPNPEPEAQPGGVWWGTNPANLLKLFEMREYMKLGSRPLHLVEGLLDIRDVNILCGDSGFGKSLFTCAIAWSGACFIPVAGFLPVVRRFKSLVLFSEGGEWDYHDRLTAWLKDAHEVTGKSIDELENAVHDHVVPIFNMFDIVKIEEYAKLRKALDAKHGADFMPHLIVIDTLSNLFSESGLDENSAVQGAQLLKSLRHLTAVINGSALVTHHPNKNGTEYRGTTAFKNNCTAMYFMGCADEHRELSLRDKVVTVKAIKYAQHGNGFDSFSLKAKAHFVYQDLDVPPGKPPKDVYKLAFRPYREEVDWVDDRDEEDKPGPNPDKPGDDADPPPKMGREQTRQHRQDKILRMLLQRLDNPERATWAVPAKVIASWIGTTELSILPILRRLVYLREIVENKGGGKGSRKPTTWQAIRKDPSSQQAGKPTFEPSEGEIS
jgi:hypothetical protein